MPNVTTDTDEMLDGYVLAALWSTSIEEDHAARHNAATGENRGADASMFDIGMTADDIDPDTLAKMRADCEAFITTNATDLAKYCERIGPWTGTDSRGYVQDEPAMARAGHDFLLTRDLTGSGFQDRGLGELGDRLADAARAFPEIWVYVGDDGKVYA